ncbi:MAG: thiamine pyrophosphate-binding protein, partial [Pseudonocardia sediminis]
MRRFGLTTVFGNPGTTEVPFLSDWPEDFHYVLGLQESVVVAMADAYAQLTRRPALVNLHSAGGVGHGLGAVFSASRNNSSVIVLAGQQARSMLGE